MSKSTRDNFTEKNARILRERVSGRCSNPECRKPTTGPKEDPNKVANVGEAAHITAAAKGGPRFDASLTPEQRREPENGIWLCRTCHTLADGDEARYTVEELQRWKAEAERLASRELLSNISLLPPQWFGRQPGSTHRFIGRQDELWQLHEALIGSDRVAVIGPRSVTQVQGMGGIGKSFLVHRYAEMFAQYWPGGICWLNATLPEGATSRNALDAVRVSQFEKVACELDIKVDELDAEQLAALVRSEVSSRERTLWIVDDLPPGLTTEEIERWLVPAHVLFTTRSREYGAIATPVDIGVMNADDGFALLTSCFKPSDTNARDAAILLAEDLGYHPLALAVAAASVERWGGYIAFGEFIRDEADGDDALEQASNELREQLPTGHEKSISKTLVRSIRELSPEGLDLLLLASNTSPAPIPARVFSRSLALVDDITASAAASKQRRAWADTDALSLSEAADGPSRTVHALVSRVTRKLADDQRRNRLLATALTALEEIMSVATDLRQHKAIEDVMPLARALLDSNGTGDIGNLAAWVGRHDFERGFFASARRLTSVALDLRRQQLGEEHPDTLTSMSDLAEISREQASFNDARKLHERVLEGRRRVLGKEHADTLASLNNLSGALHGQGDILGAREMLESVLETASRVLGEKHPVTYSAMNNLSGILKTQGDLVGCLELQERSLGAKLSTLGADHPDTLNSMSNLAVIRRAVGDLVGARLLQERVLERKRHVLGDRHPSTLTSMINLVSALKAGGELVGARDLGQEALTLTDRELGSENLATVHCMEVLAGTLRAMGDLGSALQLAERALNIRRHVLGLEHPDTLGSMNCLAEILSAQGDFDGARVLQVATLQARRSLLGELNPATLNSKHNLAATMRSQGDYCEARALEEEVLELRRTNLGVNHPDTLNSMNNLAETLRAQGDLLGAQELQECALEKQRIALGERHPDTLTSMNNLAGTYHMLGKTKQAHDLVVQALPEAQRVWGDSHSFVKCKRPAAYERSLFTQRAQDPILWAWNSKPSSKRALRGVTTLSCGTASCSRPPIAPAYRWPTWQSDSTAPARRSTPGAAA